MLKRMLRSFNKKDKDELSLDLLMSAMNFKLGTLKRIEESNTEIRGLSIVIEELLLKYKRESIIDISDLRDEGLLND